METTIKKIISYVDKGLTTNEIGKLMDLSPRTIQRYLKNEDKQERKEPIRRNRQAKAIEMHAAGFSYSEIARKMKISKTTVYLWHRKRAEQKTD